MLLVEGLRKLSQIIVNGGNASPEVLCKKYHLTKSFLHEKKSLEPQSMYVLGVLKGLNDG